MLQQPKLSMRCLENSRWLQLGCSFAFVPPPSIPKTLKFLARRGAGVVERDGLENRCTGNRTVGSNPTLSASFTQKQPSCWEF